MKIVQSCWTSPLLHSSQQLGGRFNGGWPHRLINYYSWAYSCLQLRSFYNNVELITDELGCELLVQRLQLPYTNVRLDLAKIAGNSNGLWALGKIMAYHIQQEPFLHVDNDIFIEQAFDNRLLTSPLIAQNVQSRTRVYTSTFQEVMNSYPYIPSYLEEFRNMSLVPCSNAGILGGTDLEFIHEYTCEVTTFLDRNKEAITASLNNIELSYLNVIFEQVIFYAYAKHCKKNITYLFKEATDIPHNIGYFHSAYENKHFVHALGDYKQNRMVYHGLEKKLKKEYPLYYNHITQLVERGEI